MKIWLVEDKEENVQSAQEQFKGHEIIVSRNMHEVRTIIDSIHCGSFFPELVLTDLFIPLGSAWETYLEAVKDKDPNELHPAGFVVAMTAMVIGVPCLMLTDSNSHYSLFGLMLDSLEGVADWGRSQDHPNIRKIPTKNPNKNLMVNTRPQWVDESSHPPGDWSELTPGNKNMSFVKDWKKSVRRFLRKSGLEV